MGILGFHLIIGVVKRKAEPPVFLGLDDEQIIELASNFEAIIKGLTVWKYYLRKALENN